MGNNKKIKDCTKEELMRKIYTARKLTSHWQHECIQMRADMILIKKQLGRISEHITITSRRKNVTYHSGKIQNDR